MWLLGLPRPRKQLIQSGSQGHSVHCKVKVLFSSPIICQTYCYKELQNQKMSDKYRKALKPFVIKEK